MKLAAATFSSADDSRSAGQPSSLPVAQQRPSPLELGLLAIIAGLDAVLRFHALAAKPFGLDEGVSVAIARLDGYNFVRILWRREANMSLYYLLLHPWLRLGISEFRVRTLSVLFAIVSIPMIYLLGRRLFNSRVGLIAAALLAVNAYDVEYSQEARSYPLMVFLCLLSSWYFVKCLAEPSRRNRIAYIVCSALAVYAHFFSGLLLLAQWLSLRLLDREQIPPQIKNDWRKNDWRWIAAFISPIVVFVAATGAGPLRWVQRPGLKDLWAFALQFSGNGGALLLLVYAVACLAGLLPSWQEQGKWRVSWKSWRYRFLLLWLIFPPLLIVALSWIRPLFVPRYFIFCLPALCVLAACGIARLRAAWLLGPAILVFLVLSVRGTVVGYRPTADTQRDDWRGATQYVLSHAQAGDALLFHVPIGRMPYEYYCSLQGPSSNAPLVLYPHHAGHITFLDFVEKPDDAQLERRLPEHERAWLVLSYARTPAGSLDARATELSNLLAKVYPVVEQKNFLGIEIRLYRKENSGR